MSKTLQFMPLGPLERCARLKAGEDEEFTDVLFAIMAGVSKRSIARWRVDGQVPWTSADTAAVSLGRHPRDIWGDVWYELDNYELTQKDLDSIQIALGRALVETDALPDDAFSGVMTGD